MCTLIDSEDQAQIQRVRERGWAAIDAIRAENSDKDPEEVLREVTAVVEAVRQERYERGR